MAFRNALRTLLVSGQSPFSVEAVWKTRVIHVPFHVQLAGQTPVQMDSHAMPTRLVILLLKAPPTNLRRVQPQDLLLGHHLDLQIYLHRFQRRNPQIYRHHFRRNNQHLRPLQSRPLSSQLPRQLMSLHHSLLRALLNVPPNDQHPNQHYCRRNFPPISLRNFQLITRLGLHRNNPLKSLPSFQLNSQQNTLQTSLLSRRSYLLRLRCQKIPFTVA
mmetsp:Transcript_18388/g.39503  ORF Transcript_18388/g.39503 Transcript_18388/m.39503 type:complete len:216 (-) Transcript_18388:3126-3773(-)